MENLSNEIFKPPLNEITFGMIEILLGKKNYLLHCLGLMFLIIITAACVSNEKEDKLIIAASANVRYAVEEIAELFSKANRIEYNLIISSSGKLTAQIKEGAPYDIFFSADMKYPEEIYTSGLGETNSYKYAQGRLVLWAMNKRIIPSFEILNSDQVNHIALANPITAPYGSAALEVLKNHGLHHELKSKLVFGESISQTNQFITSGAAEIGITALSAVMSPKMKDQGSWVIIDTALHKPIDQGVIVTARDEGRKNAMRFFNFIRGNEAKAILKEYGYFVYE